jgi:hypothetical protein
MTRLLAGEFQLVLIIGLVVTSVFAVVLTVVT